MKSSLPFLVGVAGPLTAVVDAHSVFTTLFVNDVTQGDGTCVRMSMDSNTCTNPIASLTSDDMACGAMGQTPVAFTCPAPAGGKLTFEWREWADASNPGVIDASHKGPCAVYAKQVGAEANSTGTAAGPGWFKLWDEGYDATTGQWCTEKLIAAKGLMSIDIPAGLPAGSWLFRPELLALQDAAAGDPQFYTGCAQVFVQGAAAGTLDVPAEYSVAIPGYVAAGEPSVSFDVYAPVFPYPLPGPPVYAVPAPSGSSSSVAASVLSVASAVSESVLSEAGLVPTSYLIKNANWVGVEVAAYTDEAGCWAASADCFDQAQACYTAAPPTGEANCRVWEAKCDDIQTACGAGNFNGPPNQGVKLQSADPAPPAAADIPAAANAVAASVASGVSVVTTASASLTASLASAVPAALAAADTSDAADTTDAHDHVSTSGAKEVDNDNSSNDTSELTVSTDGACGGDTGFTCAGSTFGSCCSRLGKCGSSRAHCGCSCQAAFGNCRKSTAKRGHSQKRI